MNNRNNLMSPRYNTSKRCPVSPPSCGNSQQIGHLPENHPPIRNYLPPNHPEIIGTPPPGHPPFANLLPPGHPCIENTLPPTCETINTTYHCHEQHKHCQDNTDKNMHVDFMPVGIGYVPWQHWSEPLNIVDGFHRGTIFPELDLPFYGCIPRGYCQKGGRR